MIKTPNRAADSRRGQHEDTHGKFNVLWTGERNVLNLPLGWHYQDAESSEITGPFETSEEAYDAACGYGG